MAARRGRAWHIPKATETGESLVAQGFDGVKAGGFDGGVHAEEEADAHGDADGEHDGPKRDG
jgi:hypothetical protein